MDTTEKIAGRVVGNTSTAESSVGFKADIQNMLCLGGAFKKAC